MISLARSANDYTYVHIRLICSTDSLTSAHSPVTSIVVRKCGVRDEKERSVANLARRAIPCIFSKELHNPIQSTMLPTAVMISDYVCGVETSIKSTVLEETDVQASKTSCN